MGTSPDLCPKAQISLGTRWIEPLIGSLTGVPVHPNATGQAHDALDVEKAMQTAGIR